WLKLVIVAVHGAFVGVGVDFISACDIHYCAQDAWFRMKVKVGLRLAVNIRTLQRLPRIVGSQKLGVDDTGEGDGSRGDPTLFPNKVMLLEGALEVAVAIAAHSPVTVQDTKVNLIYSHDHRVPESLCY
ncbi:PREDICTED: delta(3,5)-Delta(2,4)-dienoyl-CoA isomerase, mitochondrial, partial [Apaloderma vittatum]|uniref:delta(3,5)-Delta(2,4)-dienoyl-CoA isomerase, mitochondrial n=1 Tax=Apaloderma vittatum TaxID=57397 RepID=UPI00052149FC